MREFEMRRRIEGFLKRRMQGMLAPALGLGLAVTGCGESSAVYSSPAPKEDAAGLSSGIPIYSAPVAPDAYVADAFVGEDTLPPGSDASLVDLTLVPDAGSDAMGEAGGGVDAVPGGDGADAGTRVDSGADLNNMTTKYMAQLPDAGRDLGAMPLYMAALPLG